MSIIIATSSVSLYPPSSFLGSCDSSLSPGNCTQNVTIDGIFSLTLISDITCFQCAFMAEIPTSDVIFTINNSSPSPDDGVISSGVLVFLELIPPLMTVRCTNTINTEVYQIIIVVIGKSNDSFTSTLHKLIMKATCSDVNGKTSFQN